MKLLFDQNLSYRSVDLLSDVFPQSTHVRLEGLATATDSEVWEFAQNHEYVIVSKDSDFHQRSLAVSSPPKVIWIQRGNCTTDEIARILRTHSKDIQRFVAARESTFLELA